MYRLVLILLLVVSFPPMTVAGNTNLVEAAFNNDITTIKKAIENNADINSKNKNNVTLLMAASMKGYKDLVVFLLNNKANPNITNLQGVGPLYAACMFGHTGVVEILLQNGAKPNTEINEVISTPLMSAVVNYRKHIVQILLVYGADPGIQNKEGETALSLAKDNEIITILKQHKHGS